MNNLEKTMDKIIKECNEDWFFLEEIGFRIRKIIQRYFDVTGVINEHDWGNYPKRN